MLKKLFCERRLILCQNGKMRCLCLGVKTQVSICAALLCLLTWGIVTTRFYVRYDDTLSERNEQVSSLRESYSELLNEVAAYRDHIASVSEKLNDNMLTALEKQQRLGRLEMQEEQAEAEGDSASLQGKMDSLSREVEKIEQERTRLQNEFLLVQGRLSVLSDASFVKNEDDKAEVSLHKAILQRNLTASENKQLRERLTDLENLVSQMQDAQMVVFQKMGDMAQGGINEIETRLTDVRSVLARTGLSMDYLLSRMRRENLTASVGGPFVPAHMPNLKHKNLNISLVSLNTRLNRWYDLNALEEALPVGKPVDRIRITSPFGAREDPFQGAPARHEAVDLGGMTGEPVYATAPGKVTRAGKWGWYGNVVEIDHGMGFRTRYAHMDKVFVQKGEAVRSGDKIGSVGSTGRSTGPHLHYEIRVQGYPVDPMSFIKANKNVFKN